MSTHKQATSNEVKEVKTPKLLPMVNQAKTPEEKEKTTLEMKIEKLGSYTPLTAKERIARRTIFDQVSKRYEHLESKSNDLEMFEAGNDKMNARICLENEAGFKFEVRNSNVIQKVLSVMKEELNILKLEAENEVLTFEI